MNTSIVEYGAAAGKVVKSTAAIQTALDACVRTGGGTVSIPAGEFLSGPLRMGSGVHLHLEAGATLWASPDPEDYGGRAEEKGVGVFLSASEARQIQITGPGVIHGQGMGNFRGKDPRRGELDPEPLFRVKLVGFDDCEDVRIRDVTFRYSDSWTIRLRRCHRVWIEGVAILNNVHRMNSDGIDPDSCRDVHISNCHIVAGDDCIVLKSTGPEPCENIVVSNCILETTCTALKIGTESHGDFRDIHISNCVLRNTSSGIAFHVKDGATVKRVTLSSISYEDRAEDPIRYVASPLLMDLERRHADSRLGRIRDVTISDFQAHTRTGILIQGLAESPIENLVLRNVSLRVDAPLDFGERMKRVGGHRTTSDERDTLYARKPSYCTIAHVWSLRVEGLRVDIRDKVFRANPRSALWLEHVTQETVRDVTRTPADETAAPVLVSQLGPMERTP